MDEVKRRGRKERIYIGKNVRKKKKKRRRMKKRK